MTQITAQTLPGIMKGFRPDEKVVTRRCPKFEIPYKVHPVTTTILDNDNKVISYTYYIMVHIILLLIYNR